MDNFTRLADHMALIPGATRRRSTVVAAPWIKGSARETYVLETVATPEGWVILVDFVDSEGQAHRLALRDEVTHALYRQRDSILKALKSERAKRAAETRKRRSSPPGLHVIGHSASEPSA